ncbi:MAG: acetate kinase [Candidatus Omnitrophica bacterium]|nr:acetate kinase [Candidatus Omnitrophota bacterium]
MKILVINCGSSSVKYELFHIVQHKSLIKDKVERIASHSDYKKAIMIIRDRLLDPKAKLITSIRELKGIGHRVVHGGEEFKDSTIINRRVIKSIEKFIELAPLHNPPSLAGIKACIEIFPRIKQVAVFDTAFHQSMPPHAFIYGIPYEYYTKYGIRRYGFHGTSHRYVSERAAQILEKPINKLKIVTVHLGNGASIAAVDRGRSIDTSMGFTPLEGLLMGTRSGDMDPFIVIYLMEKLGITPEQASDILNKKSGFLGVSGISNDMRDIIENMNKGKKRALLTFRIFVYRIKKYIGAYAAAMGGLNAVVFTGGIGEKVTSIRLGLEKELAPMFKNKVDFLMIPTNEELLIARDTARLVKGVK